jgi:hypothetical protein
VGLHCPHLSPKMTSIQAPACVHYHDLSRNGPVISGAECLHIDAISRRSTVLEEENVLTRKSAESAVQYKLPTYQAAAVVVRTIRS